MGRLEKLKIQVIAEANKRMLNEYEDWLGVGGLRINDANMEKVGDSVKITFSMDNIPRDSQLREYGRNFNWNCTITLTKNGDMVDGKVECGGEGKHQGKDVESSIMSIVDDFPKPADTNNFSPEILNLF
jgi:hypothetical protein